MLLSKIYAQDQNVIVLNSKGNNPTLIYDSNETTVVKNAVEMFRTDLFEIIGKKLAIQLNSDFKNSSITAGKHALRLFGVDPDVVIDRIMIDFKTNRKFYGGSE